MLMQLRHIRRKNPSKACIIYRLIHKGKLKRYFVNGYTAIDSEEYKEYCKKKRVGRPCKAIIVGVDYALKDDKTDKGE